jgi:hypothetical protein
MHSIVVSEVLCRGEFDAKINAAGEWIDRTEATSMNDLFERMSVQTKWGMPSSAPFPMIAGASRVY